ncbi:MAG: AMP-dependent synthetase/ligase, partial [Solirubrobacterales bacterium]
AARANDPAQADRVAMREKRLGIWQEITWKDYWEIVQDVAHGYLSLGVAPGDRIAIHSENRPEWLFADVGALAARAVSLGLYPTNPPAEVRYLLDDGGARILVAEDQEQVDKALEVKGDLDKLERIVYLEGRGVTQYDDPMLVSWRELLARGREHRAAHPGLLSELAAQVRPEDLVTLIYTSGTTGPPKGAMLTVRNIEFAIETLVDRDGLYPDPRADDVSLSYLPLAHVADRAGSEWLHAQSGIQLHFGEAGAELGLTLREVQPSVFFGVPRVWEKMRATAEVRMAAATPLKRLAYRFWMRQAHEIARTLARTGGVHTPGSRVRSALGSLFVFRALRARMGMRRCRFALSGAAPVSPDLLQWFMGIGVVIHEIYGMTENCAVATVNRPGRLKIGTVGEVQPRTELRLDEATGEILTRHPANFAGYWKKPEATAQALDADGWLHTGDVGEWLDGTHLRIVDRLKDILITAGGKNISPSEIENALKFSPYVKEAIVIGDRRPYLVAIIGIELDTAGDWAQLRSLPYTTYRDLSEKPEVIELIRGVIVETNERLARVEQVKKFRMITKELDHEDGELTATQKVKRATMAKMLDHLIEDMYGNRSECAGAEVEEREP